MSSHYDFPIFVSSTVYNLVDLRAELREHLDQLGYRVVLSSEDGFPDQTPGLEPWESCLPVLARCHIVIIIVDGRYGTRFQWPHFLTQIGTNNIAPTHAEYRFARHLGKRVLIFIRDELMNDYQRFRQHKRSESRAANSASLDTAKTKPSPELFLPEHVDQATLEFIEEIKTHKPIPWIREFANVTEVKHEVHRQLLNELACIFAEGQDKLEYLVRKMSAALDQCDPETKKGVLKKIGVTDEFQIQITRQSDLIKELQTQLSETQSKLTRAQAEKIVEAGEVKRLIAEKEEVERQIRDLQRRNADAIMESTGSIMPLGISGMSGYSGNTTAQSPVALGLSHLFKDQYRLCPKCAASNLVAPYLNFKYCARCKRTLCPTCFDGLQIFRKPIVNPSICSDCQAVDGIS